MLFKFSDHSQSVALQCFSCFQFPLQQLLYLPEPLLFCIFEANYLAYESVITAGRAIYAGCFFTRARPRELSKIKFYHSCARVVS